MVGAFGSFVPPVFSKVRGLGTYFKGSDIRQVSGKGRKHEGWRYLGFCFGRGSSARDFEKIRIKIPNIDHRQKPSPIGPLRIAILHFTDTPPSISAAMLTKDSILLQCNQIRHLKPEEGVSCPKKNRKLRKVPKSTKPEPGCSIGLWMKFARHIYFVPEIIFIKNLNFDENCRFGHRTATTRRVATRMVRSVHFVSQLLCNLKSITFAS